MGRNSKSEERKKEILQGCYDVINREGLENATLRRIGEERKIAPSLVSHYFKRKEDLLAELVDFTFEKEHGKVLPALTEGESPEEKLDLYIRRMITLYLGQNIEDKVFYSCFYKSLFDQEIHEKFEAIYDPEQNMLGDLVKELKDKQKDLDVSEFVLFINIFIEGMNFMHAILGDDERFGRITDKFTALVQEMIRS